MEKERAKRVRVYKVLTAVKAHSIQVREQEVKMRWGEGEILYYYCIKLFWSKLTKVTEKHMLLYLETRICKTALKPKLKLLLG